MEQVGVISADGQTRAKREADHELAVMGVEGDVKTIWDPSKPEEVTNARETFDRMRAKGYLAFRVNKKGEKGEQIREFDPDAAVMLMVPQMAGG